MLVVLSTFPSAEKAAEVVRLLVEERLIACANLLPQVRSIYRWQGAICDEVEVLAVMKTTEARRGELEARLAALHPYETPEIVVLAAEAAANYAAWVLAETSRGQV